MSSGVLSIATSAVCFPVDAAKCSATRESEQCNACKSKKENTYGKENEIMINALSRTLTVTKEQADQLPRLRLVPGKTYPVPQIGHDEGYEEQLVAFPFCIMQVVLCDKIGVNEGWVRACIFSAYAGGWGLREVGWGGTVASHSDVVPVGGVRRGKVVPARA
jgi:hypothetical protein